jgi:RNA ligase (TIGR02306 family)
MSQFAVRVTTIDSIECHPDADAIEIAMIGGYRSIVRKVDGFSAGSPVVYIPQVAMLPEYLLRRLGLWNEELGQGKLGGPEYNRVSPMKLRGVFSQGICMKVEDEGSGHVRIQGSDGCFTAEVGEDVADRLGIEKWVPVIPSELVGDVFVVGQPLTVNFDVEDIKAHPDIIHLGEEVEFREKLHGVFTGVSLIPVSDALPEAFGEEHNILVYSKGLGAQGMAYADTQGNSKLPHVRSTLELRARLEEYSLDDPSPLTIMGETFGPGVQDLHYGTKVQFRIFAACRGYRGDQKFLGANDLRDLAARLGIEMVPVLYRGPFSWEALAEHTSGPTAMDAKHIREGVVVTPVLEREDMRLGRVALKSVSEKYLLRKGGTEYS